MKKILAILLTIFLCTTTTAQITNSIVIDRSSFRAVQTDELTGVNIDPIGLDHSRQACARIKIKFDRMNKAQIDALEVKMHSNTDLIKQKVADYYDNVLILEMTAKPNTRFYFYSPEFGESNEVTLNLEGNREYEMLASLNQAFSIVVESNVVNADVYLDGVFKGQTGDSMKCTISDVMIGGHSLKVVYGKVSGEKNIDVNKNSIFFTQNIDQNVTEVNTYKVGDYYNDGVKEGVVFEVSADGRRGKIVSMKQSTVRLQWSSNIKEQKRLIAANRSTDGAVNMAKVMARPDWQSKYPAFKWCADLGEGWYLPSKEELRTIYKYKDKLNPNLTDELSDGLFWSSTEYNYKYLDGKSCAWYVLVGSGITNCSTQKFKTGYVRAVSAFGDSSKSKLDETIVSNHTTSAPYKVGDYYNENGKQGVVFEVSADGCHGKIVSIMQSGILQWSSDGKESRRLIGAYSTIDGAYNMAQVKAISGWRGKYPAIKWCADLGEGWYLPSKEELRTIYNNKNEFNLHLTDELSGYFYWSSTECNHQYLDGVYCAWLVDFMDNFGTHGETKSYYRHVRAVSAF